MSLRTGPVKNPPAPKTKPAAPITLTEANVGKASDIARTQVQAAIILVEGQVRGCKTDLEVTLTPNFARTKGMPSPEPRFQKGVKVKGPLSGVEMNSVMQVKVRAKEAGKVKEPVIFSIQLASDNLAKAGVRIFSARQMGDLIAGFSANAGKTFTP